MILLLALLSVGLMGLAVALPGESDLLFMLAAPCLIAAIWLLMLRLSRPRPTAPARRADIIVDGSNVLHWNDGVPSLRPVMDVIRELMAQGLTVDVMFDANVGYKIGTRYLHDRELALQIGLPEEQVRVVSKGTQADHHILRAARRFQAQVVSNDRFRDWQAEFPEVDTPGFLIRGGMREGSLWLSGVRAAPKVLAAAGP